MTKVTAQMSVSLDGFYAGPAHTGDGSWVDSAEAAGFFRITRWATEAAAWRERQGFAGGEEEGAAFAGGAPSLGGTIRSCAIATPDRRHITETAAAKLRERENGKVSFENMLPQNTGMDLLSPESGAGARGCG